MNTALDFPPEVMAAGRAKPVGWITKILGYELQPVQIQMAKAVRDFRQVAVKSCHGSGKTHLAGSLALWFVYNYENSLCLLTGPTYRQVEVNAYAELTKAYQGSKIPLGGDLLRTCRLRLGAKRGVLGMATDKPVNLSGFHNDHILVIVDEASGVEEGLFQSLEGLRSAGRVTLLLLSQGTQTAGTFFNAFHRERRFWECITISAFDTPNFQPDVLSQWLGVPVEFPEGASQQEMAQHLQALWEAQQPPADYSWPKHYLVNPAWACELAAKNDGVESDQYVVRVLGGFPSGDPHALIALHWVDAAVNRVFTGSYPETWMGLDVARFGDDSSYIFCRRGPIVIYGEERNGQDTVATAGWAAEIARRFGVTDINVDVVGVGAGVADQLRSEIVGVKVHDINVGAQASDTERFLNKRAEHFWGLRERFSMADISLAAIPRSELERLSPELTGTKWHTTPAGKTVIESKDEYKKRLHRSPDAADALMLAFAKPNDDLVIFSGRDDDPTGFFDDFAD